MKNEISSSSSDSIIRDIIIEEQTDKKITKKQNFNEKFEGILNKNKEQKLGLEGIMWMQQELSKSGVKPISYSKEQDETKEVILSSSSQYSSESEHGIKYKKQQQNPEIGQLLELHQDKFIISDGIITITNLSESQESIKKQKYLKNKKLKKNKRLDEDNLNSISEVQDDFESIIENRQIDYPQAILENSPNQDDIQEEYFDECEQGEDEMSEYNQYDFNKELPSGCGCQPRVLIVDDIQFNILPVRSMVSDFTKFIEEAGNGQIAVDMFKQGLNKLCGCPNRAFKLIYMDLQMPVKGGYEASLEIFKLQKEARKEKRLQERIFLLKQTNSDFEQIQNLEQILLSGKIDDNLFDQDELKPTEEEEKTECRIVVLTSWTNEVELNQCLQMGCSKVVNKPVNYEKLHEIMWLHFFRVGHQDYLKIYQEQFDKPFLN